ncbi:MAG: aldehyde dehydrogenase family protein, partial [Pigmentiphaga sp.]
MTTARKATPAEAQDLLAKLGVTKGLGENGSLAVTSPIDGGVIARLPELTAEQARERVGLAHTAFLG